MTSFKIGQKVTTHQNDTGTIIRIDKNPKNKPYIVELDNPRESYNGKLHKGYYHKGQLTIMS